MTKKIDYMLDTYICSFIMREQPITGIAKAAVDATTEVKRDLMAKGTPIGSNDTAIAGHAIASGRVLVTNSTKEFKRVSHALWFDSMLLAAQFVD